MNRRILLLTIPLAILSIVCVCPSFETEYFAQAQPKAADLVGTYVPTADTLDFVRKEGGYQVVEPIEIILKADGNFEMHHMPDWWRTEWGESEGGFDSGDGQWTVSKQQDWWDVEFQFKSREHFSEPVSNGFVTFIPIYGQAPPYKLWFYIGDPDGGDVMIFERRP
jgi:hypothetical protein